MSFIEPTTTLVNQLEIPYIQRDLSWLSFNHRVLQEARDHSVPLFERIRFLAIYSSNLSEFFRVRMANHRYMLRIGKETKRELDYDPKEVIKQIHKVLSEQQDLFFDTFYNEIIPELKEHNIRLLRRAELNDKQIKYIEDYFQNRMLTYVQPVLLVKNKIRPFLNNDTLYLAIWMKDKEDQSKKSSPIYAIVQIPSGYLPRFVELPFSGDSHDLIMLDDIIRHNVAWMFPGYDLIDTFSIKLTRDAELYIDDEHSGDLVQKIRDTLVKRAVGPASRFVYDKEMPEELLTYLKETFELDKYDILPEGRYHNNFDLRKMPNFGKTYLDYAKLPPLPYVALEKTNDYFGGIQEKDHLIYVPYHSYESVIQFFIQAANDPDVTHIKLIQYRVASDSRVMDALMDAVALGKQVFVFVEVKARFDEEANLKWGERLAAAGVQVKHSFPGVKVHAKLALVRRQKGEQVEMFSYLGTGNFHEVTAKIYSDFGLFTANTSVVNEVARVFAYLETREPQEFQHLLVGQFNLRSGLIALIDQEIANAKAGKEAKILLKLNSLQDAEMIAKLYEASQAGVKIQLIIRGICSLATQQKGWSDNIEAISIVDRFLEHARVFVFHNEGEEKIYLSSADWMVRNLSFRVETAFPIYDEALKKEIKSYINLQLSDNTKARILDSQQTNTYRKANTDIPIRSQIDTYYHIKRKMDVG